MSDERFARQYRFRPPPEFLLASSCTSIVHHLSGPIMFALIRRNLGNAYKEGRGGGPLRVPFAFAPPDGFLRPPTRRHVRLLGPCFKTGRRPTSCQTSRGRKRGPIGRGAHPRSDRRAAERFGRYVDESGILALSNDSPLILARTRRRDATFGNPSVNDNSRPKTRAVHLPRTVLRRRRAGFGLGQERDDPVSRVANSRPDTKQAYASLLAVSGSFDPLFRVLFTFPSQYLCAIGFPAYIQASESPISVLEAAFSNNPTL